MSGGRWSDPAWLTTWWWSGVVSAGVTKGSRGGGHCLFEIPKTKLQTPGSVLPQPSLTALAGLQPPVFKVSKDSILLLQLLMRLALSGRHFQLS